MKKAFSFTVLMVTCALMQVNIIYAQNPGDRAQKFRGTWWSGVHVTLLDDRMLDFKTLDGFGVGFTNGATLSAEHFAPVPLLSNLAGADAVFPPDNDTYVLDQMIKVTDAGFMVQAYTNCENFLGSNAGQFDEFTESWKNWCDTNPVAQEFINSQSYHTQAGYPDRPYMFCYAEFILKYYSLQYGQYIDIWVFDDGHSMVEHGDNATSGNINDQRLYLAFADAARAGNDDIAVAFNNGRSTVNYDSYPFAHATRGDDFTFGHAFGGNNNHAEKVNGNQFNLNYQHVERMTETNGYVHDGGAWTWDDNIVGHFFSKLSTTAWNFGPVQAWEQNDFNQWHEEALSAGGMMTWSGSYNRTITGYYEWVYDLLKACDDYLYERGISVNGADATSFTPDPNKTYYIDNSHHNLRLAADGESEDAYTTSTDTTGDDVEWQFVDKGNGYWHLQRAAGGTNPRLRTDNSSSADMQATTSNGVYTYYDFTTGAINDTHFLTLPDGPANYKRLQVDNSGNVNMVTASHDGTWESFTITEASGGSNVVHITKRNAPEYAMDGGNGASDGQDVYLWSANANNTNQQWVEIDRGDGYYSYQKQGTNHCMDGGNGGANSQNVYIWTCADNNQNQHWRKVDVGSGYYRLEKRNAPGFSINGGSGGADGQSINLWNSSSSSTNLHWGISTVNTAKSSDAKEIDSVESFKLYPNPVKDNILLSIPVNSISIIDITGRVIKSFNEETKKINVSDLPSGIYIFKGFNSEDKPLVRRFLK